MNDREANDIKRQSRFLSIFFPKEIPPIPTNDERKPYPQQSANIFSRSFYWWLNPLLFVGYSRTLEPQDLFYLTDDIKVDAMAQQFYENFAIGVAKAHDKYINKKLRQRHQTRHSSTQSPAQDLSDFTLPRFTLVWAIFLTWKWQYLKACFYLSLSSAATTVNPLLIKELIQHVDAKAAGVEFGPGKCIGFAVGASSVIFIAGLLMNHFVYYAKLTGAQVRAVLIKAILEKSFKLDQQSHHKYSSGKIMSMMGTDVSRIDFAIGCQPFIITFPIPFAIATTILIINIGWPSAISIALMLLFMLAIAGSSRKLIAFRAKVSPFTDARINYIKEALNQLKIIKFYSWEFPYHQNIANLRHQEMNIMYTMQILRNIVTAVAMSLSSFSALMAFLIVHAVNQHKHKRLDPASVFASVTIFNILTNQVYIIPSAIAYGSDAFVALKRVGEYLCSPEIDPLDNSIEATPEIINQNIPESNDAIIVKNANFKWEKFDNEITKEWSEKYHHKDNNQTFSIGTSDKDIDTDSSNTKEVTFTGLKNINLNIKKGQFVVITGLVGSGKTSLLMALSGLMKRSSGIVEVDGDFLLCGHPWIQNATVKQNIIFGKELDEVKYQEVISVCSLLKDLRILPGGDQAEIGERGITLSGGQKARINLARAVYANADIILLDDVLSAVDARVGKDIMNNCILGTLKTKTRILATHQLSLVGSADKIVFINADGSTSSGSFDSLIASNIGFRKLMAYNNDRNNEDKEKSVLDEQNQFREREGIRRQTDSTLAGDSVNSYRLHRDLGSGALIDKEEKATNAIAFDVYKTYFKLGSGKYPSWLILPLFVTTMILATFCQIFTNTWLSFWTSNKFTQLSNNIYIGFYVMFTILAFVLLTCEYMLLVYITNTASVNLNVLSVKRMLHTPMSFMDTTPMGRVLNRFTNDTNVLDNQIGDDLRLLLFALCNIVGILILCVIYLPWFGIALPFVGLVFYSISNYYQATSREVKRIEAIQRSLVYNNFNETLDGMDTIKAYKGERMFLTKNDTLIDSMNEAYYITIANQRWLGINVDIVGTFLALIIALLSVFRVFDINASSVGLLLSNIFQVAGQLSMLTKSYSQVENEMNSVERLCEYAYKVPVEAASYVTETTPHPKWPDQGSIQFENVSLAYRPGLPLVLENLNFSIQGREKIGICGRTGAGKSSIMTVLYRLSELTSGKIWIDGIDISVLGLHTLRSKLSIIPQDPVLFRGTIRKNLDPFNKYEDSVLWDSLRRTGLIENLGDDVDNVMLQVKGEGGKTGDLHKFHLDQEVNDDGKNFSLGERQLIAFSRAIVRGSKILILDEATSAVDYETDFKIQQTIAQEFSQCTILCIAHRLKTIVNYDRILVLDKGKLQEFDTPLNLFNQKGSIFQKMCDRSGITDEDFQKASFNT